MTSTPPPSVDVLILGAGISGLVTAHHVKKGGSSVAVLESSDRAGGSIRSEWKDGFLLEHGPNTVMPTSEIMVLIEDLHLENDMLIANPKAARFIQWNGRLHALPLSPPALLKTQLLSLKGRLRLLAEPLLPRRKVSREESLYDFARRRLGSEATERLLSPFVSGVWAGDPHQLSAEGAFPKLVEAERTKGSLVRGMLALRRKNGSGGPTPPKGLLSFKNGLETLPRTLHERLEANVFFNTTPTRLDKQPEGWTVQGKNFSCRAKHIVFCQPAGSAAELIQGISNEAADALRQIPYASLIALHMGIEQTAVDHPLNGFGFLIAPKEGSEVLGCLWNSSLFPRRAPEGQALLTVFIGGARHLGSVNKTDDVLFDLAFQNLNRTLGFRKRPRLLNLTRYEKAIPQYTLGHVARAQTIRNFEAANPGLHMAGNTLWGISVGDVTKTATAVSSKILSGTGSTL